MNYVIKLVDDFNLVKNEFNGIFNCIDCVVKVVMLFLIGNVFFMFLIVEVKVWYFKFILDISIGFFYFVKSWLEEGNVDIVLIYE